jgi:hypothetical protein
MVPKEVHKTGWFGGMDPEKLKTIHDALDESLE